MNQVNAIEKHKSWKDWFNSRESSSLVNKKHQERLFKIFDSSISNDKCKSELEIHGETVFLFQQNFRSNKVNLFHHLKSIGGNLCVEKQEFGMIQGVQENATCILTLAQVVTGR